MIPELLTEYPEGSDITIMNTYYSYPKFEDGKKVEDDHMFLVYKDNKTGKKGYRIIDKPTYTFYKIKEGEEVPFYNELFISRDKVEPITVPYCKLEANLAHVNGFDEEYKANLMNRNKAANQVFHTMPNIFNSDTNIEDHYRFKFAQTYTNEITKLSKGFFDIEVDGKWAAGDFVEMGECAVNCVSYYDSTSDTVYAFVLRDHRNPQIAALEEEFKSGKFGWQQMHDFIVENVGGKKKAFKYKLLDTKFKVEFYDAEIELLSDLFQTMHHTCPDFILSYNGSAFDIPYIIARIQRLGYRPEDIMCDRSWKVKVVKNMVDEKNISDLPERGDFTFISGLPIFIDQMIQYASRRKAKFGSYSSFKLDDIGLKEAGVKKLDYSHITHSVTELPWLDFKTFFLYNIMDVIVQKCIEAQCNDMEYIFAKCVTNNTSYRKGHRQTVYLINRMANDWFKKGFIIGNNINKGSEAPPKYLGALVGNPDNTNDYSKMKINGRVILVCENLVDYDFKSLYPSLMAEFNIAPNTQIGKIEIDHVIYEGENAYGIEAEKYSRGGEFIENMVTDNFIEFCVRWFKLGTIQDVLEDADEYYNKYRLGNFTNLLDAGYRNPVLPTARKHSSAISFGSKKPVNPITINVPRDPQYTYNNLIRKDDEYADN